MSDSKRVIGQAAGYRLKAKPNLVISSQSSVLSTLISTQRSSK